MNLCKLLLVPMALLTVAGCGSDPKGASQASAGRTGSGDDAAKTCGDPTLAIDPTAMIDDMESPAPSTLLRGNSGGEWWAGGDDASKATGAKITPDGDAPAELIPGGRCGSKYALHVTGQGFQSWSDVSASFGWGAPNGGADRLLPYDAHSRAGLTFWARIGDTSTASVRLNVTDQYSNEAGGICDKTVASGDTACYDYFGVELDGLDVVWKQYKIPFSGLSQQMFGIPRPAVDTASLYSVDFAFPNGSVFDLWVDDISFY
jgi:hypothetical protein